MPKKKNDTNQTPGKQNKPKRTRKEYSDDFKKNAIKLLITNDSNVTKTAKELGIARQMLINWRKDERFKVDEDAILEIKRKGSVTPVSTLNDPEVEQEISQAVIDAIQKLGTLIPKTNDVYKLTTIVKTLTDAHEKINGGGSVVPATTINNYVQNLQNVYNENVEK